MDPKSEQVISLNPPIRKTIHPPLIYCKTLMHESFLNSFVNRGLKARVKEEFSQLSFLDQTSIYESSEAKVCMRVFTTLACELVFPQ